MRSGRCAAKLEASIYRRTSIFGPGKRATRGLVQGGAGMRRVRVHTFHAGCEWLGFLLMAHRYKGPSQVRHSSPTSTYTTQQWLKDLISTLTFHIYTHLQYTIYALTVTIGLSLSHLAYISSHLACPLQSVAPRIHLGPHVRTRIYTYTLTRQLSAIISPRRPSRLILYTARCSRSTPAC